jgi:hypothetical protein
MREGGPVTDDELDARLRDALAAEQIRTSALERAIRSRIRPSRTGWYAAAAAAATVAFVALSMPRSVPAAFQEAARDHQLEVVEHRPRHWQATAPDAARFAPAGYRLEHAKICGLEGRRVLHMVYTDGAHEVSVYLASVSAKAQGPPDAAPKNGGPHPSSRDPAARTCARSLEGEANVDGEHVAVFHSGPVSGLIVGPASECRKFLSAL